MQKAPRHHSPLPAPRSQPVDALRVVEEGVDGGGVENGCDRFMQKAPRHHPPLPAPRSQDGGGGVKMDT